MPLPIIAGVGLGALVRWGAKALVAAVIRKVISEVRPTGQELRVRLQAQVFKQQLAEVAGAVQGQIVQPVGALVAPIGEIEVPPMWARDP